MKILITILILSSITKSQVLTSLDYEDTTNLYNNWEIKYFFYAPKYYNQGAYGASLNSLQISNRDLSLISPEFNSAFNVYLSFDYAFSIYYTQASFAIKTSTNNGTTWNDFKFISGDFISDGYVKIQPHYWRSILLELPEKTNKVKLVLSNGGIHQNMETFLDNILILTHPKIDNGIVPFTNEHNFYPGIVNPDLTLFTNSLNRIQLKAELFIPEINYKDTISEWFNPGERKRIYFKSKELDQGEYTFMYKILNPSDSISYNDTFNIKVKVKKKIWIRVSDGKFRMQNRWLTFVGDSLYTKGYMLNEDYMPILKYNVNSDLWSDILSMGSLSTFNNYLISNSSDLFLISHTINKYNFLTGNFVRTNFTIGEQYTSFIYQDSLIFILFNESGFSQIINLKRDSSVYVRNQGAKMNIHSLAVYNNIIYAFGFTTKGNNFFNHGIIDDNYSIQWGDLKQINNLGGCVAIENEGIFFINKDSLYYYDPSYAEINFESMPLPFQTNNMPAIGGRRLKNNIIELYIMPNNDNNELWVYKYKSNKLTTNVDPDNSIISDFSLEQNYPNPFNPVTNIRFYLPLKEHVTIKVYDVLGNEIKTLINEVKDIGEHNISFNAEGLSSGMYIYSIKAGTYFQNRKMILLK